MGGFSTIITGQSAKSFREIENALGAPTGGRAATPEYSVERERKVGGGRPANAGPLSQARLIGFEPDVHCPLWGNRNVNPVDEYSDEWSDPAFALELQAGALG